MYESKKLPAKNVVQVKPEETNAILMDKAITHFLKEYIPVPYFPDLINYPLLSVKLKRWKVPAMK